MQRRSGSRRYYTTIIIYIYVLYYIHVPTCSPVAWTTTTVWMSPRQSTPHPRYRRVTWFHQMFVLHSRLTLIYVRYTSTRYRPFVLSWYINGPPGLLPYSGEKDKVCRNTYHYIYIILYYIILYYIHALQMFM